VLGITYCLTTMQWAQAGSATVGGQSVVRESYVTQSVQYSADPAESYPNGCTLH